ncbi:MAG: hypothetical protein L0Z70_06745 [Chloroflexi bacterium]|nr:hypothetical protein [Chloroflexota bacterium]
MYPIILASHNLLRWVALILGILAAFRAIFGWLGKWEWTPTDRKTGSFFGMVLDIQIVLGLLLYFFLSPFTSAALRDFGAAMADSGLRFFAVEHAFTMFLAAVFAHLGSILARKAEGAAKHARAALWFTLALAALLAGMPWMRPLLPGLF